MSLPSMLNVVDSWGRIDILGVVLGVNKTVIHSNMSSITKNLDASFHLRNHFYLDLRNGYSDLRFLIEIRFVISQVVQIVGICIRSLICAIGGHSEANAGSIHDGCCRIARNPADARSYKQH